MAEYIEREAAIRRLREYAINIYGIDLSDNTQFSGSSLSENYCEGLFEATELIDDLPAADVAPVVYGMWTEIRNYHGELEGWIHEECGREVKCAESYCPNCGALMFKEE